jgi:endogenous inhibitor of DNA gyrase (YacG/DUF329 family)
MTRKQITQVEVLRLSGKNCATIANMLGISENTIKSYCRRKNTVVNPITPTNIKSNVKPCPQCGCVIKHTPGIKRKRFCSDKCRMAWWNAHPDFINRKAFYHFTCVCCGKPFDSYGNKYRKYCSRICYLNARKDANNDK